MRPASPEKGLPCRSTPPPPPRTRRSALLTTGVILAFLLAAVDVAGVIAFAAEPAPIEITIAILVLAALTVVGGIVALLGRRWGGWLAVVSRFLSIAPMIPVLLVPGIPAEVVTPTYVQIVVTVVVIVLLLVALLRRPKA